MLNLPKIDPYILLDTLMSFPKNDSSAIDFNKIIIFSFGLLLSVLTIGELTDLIV